MLHEKTSHGGNKIRGRCGKLMAAQRTGERVIYRLEEHRHEFSLTVFFFLWIQMKTVSVALVMCLNVGVDPPDVLKVQPCARLECWIGIDLFTSIRIIITITIMKYSQLM